MDDPFRKLLDELQSLATEDEQPRVVEESTSTVAISEPEPAKPPATRPSAMPLPRNVRGRRY